MGRERPPREERGHSDVFRLQKVEPDLMEGEVEEDSDSQEEDVVEVGVESLTEGGGAYNCLTGLTEHEVRRTVEQEVGGDGDLNHCQQYHGDYLLLRVIILVRKLNFGLIEELNILI